MTRRSRARLGSVVATVALHYFALGCTSSASRDGHPDRGNTPSDAGSPRAGGAGDDRPSEGGAGGAAPGSAPGRAGGGAETTGMAGGGGPAGEGGAGVAGDAAVASSCAERLPRRLVRLTWDQLLNSLEGLLGPEVAAELREEHEIPAGRGVFSGLRAPREGHVIGDAQWLTADAIADAAGTWVEDHFDAVSGCGDDLGCARDFIAAFTEAAFRRPPSGEELDNVLSVFDDAVELDASAALAARYGVYAALSSPLFLYRSELGLAEAPGPSEPMTGHELASALSFFLTDRPPDEALLEKAATGQLGSEMELAAEVERLLSSEVARRNLELAMADYVGLYVAETTVLDAAVYPELSAELRTFAVEEGHRFLANELWGSPLGSLITSPRSFVNQELAALYGVPFPPAGATLDPDGFAAVQLDEGRAGVMTQLAFLLSTSRPDAPSVVSRGLRVNKAFACASAPPLEAVDPETIQPPPAPDATQRELAALRAEDPNCGGCHTLFDPYGLVLHSYDALARHRTVDEAGHPIDPLVALPELVGGQTVASANELGEALVSSGRLSLCLAEGFAAHALVDDALGACMSKSLVAEPAFVEEPTFSELLRLIALSEPFRLRTLETP